MLYNQNTNSLMEENNRLKQQLSQKEQYYNNEINKLNLELNKYKQENKNLQNSINNLISNNPMNFQNNFNQINILTNENNNLKQKINDKEKEINNLKLQLKNNKPNKPKLFELDDIIVVNFMSTDQIIRDCSIKCLKTDRFFEVEEKLYQLFDEFRNTNNVFAVRGNTILRFKTLSENGIRDGDKIQLLKFDDTSIIMNKNI